MKKRKITKENKWKEKTKSRMKKKKHSIYISSKILKIH